jgi:hypothetical protein
MAFDTPRGTDQTELSRTRLQAVHNTLRAHGIASQLNDDVLTNEGDRPAAHRCGPRADDAGQLWLYEPVAPADAEHLHEVITWAKERTADRAGVLLNAP